jgi:hypothetical protein
MRDLIYICSPLRAYFGHSQASNIADAANYSRFAYVQGYTPIATHLMFTRFMDDTQEKERVDAIIMCQELLRNCNQLWVFGDYISPGMEHEIALAKQWGIPIKWFKVQSNKDMPLRVKIKYKGGRQQ